jgi:hypothetical protein
MRDFLTKSLIVWCLIVLCINAYQIKKQLIKPDDYFICCYEKVADNFYQVVYMKNGETYYPHFTDIRQVHSFMDKLETLGTLDRNGYEIRGNNEEAE